MAKLSHLLDDLQIKHWIKQGEPIAKSDGHGLTFTLSKSGTATWVLRYRMGAGRRKELTIGNYPDLPLAAARKKSRELRVEIDNGDNPAENKQKAKTRSAGDWTMKMLLDDYKLKRLTLGSFAPGTIKYRNYDFDQVIEPKLGKRKVSEVTPLDIVHMIKGAKRSWTISKRILTATSQLFDHANGLQIISINPCGGISLVAMLGDRPVVRKRVMLDEDELRVVLSGIDEIGMENALAFRILLVTCVRSVELAKAKWEHVNLKRGTWWVPDDVVKTRNGFMVPLVPAVVKWFRQLQELAGESEWVLPARVERRVRRGLPHVGETTLWAAFKRAFERGDISVRRFTPHDTRSTAKGHMRNMGISRDISEIALNHTLKGMEGIYDVREEIPERRQALEKWAAFVVACENGEPTATNVIPLRSGG
ncbi:MAG: tyrosine-type recombinase/integrase [Janthinobacterium lividum]